MSIGTTQTDFYQLLQDMLEALQDEFGNYNDPELAQRIQTALVELSEL